MLADIKSNIEARYVSRSTGMTDIILSEVDGITSRAIYLNNGQQYTRETGNKKVILHLFQGVAAFTISAQDQQEVDQLLKGDIIVLPAGVGFSVRNQTASVLIMSEIVLD